MAYISESDLETLCAERDRLKAESARLRTALGDLIQAAEQAAPAVKSPAIKIRLQVSRENARALTLAKAGAA